MNFLEVINNERWKIQLPLIGTQSINGLTLDEAKLKLVELYKKIY